MSKISESNPSPEEKIRLLEKENEKLRKKIERLKKTMEITSRHGDVVTGELEQKVEASIREIEQHVRLISETIPVPVIISRITDGKFLYVNEHTCNVFGYSHEQFMDFYALKLYDSPPDRQKLIGTLNEKGRVTDFEVKMKKRDGTLLWAALFSQPLEFKNQACILTVVYDLTERKQAEEEIRRLNEKLDQKEVKYLMFTLDGEEYGIEITKAREIVSVMPIIPVAEAPPDVKGVMNLRGRVLPVIDLRLRLGLYPSDYTDQTCIIVIEAGDAENTILKGIIVDTVTDVRGIRVRDIEFPQLLDCLADMRFISGVAKTENRIKVLLNCSQL
jgi:purine-binding chemotaxis protein CheW